MKFLWEKEWRGEKSLDVTRNVHCGQFIQPFIVASTDVIHTYICRYFKTMLKKLQAWGYLFSRNWSPHLEISCPHHLRWIGHKLTSIPTVPVPELGYDPADPVLEPLSSPTPKGLHTFQFGRTNLNPTKKSPSESLQTCPMRPDTRRQGPHLQYQSRLIFNVLYLAFYI